MPFIITAVAVVAATAGGWYFCQSLKWDAHPPEMWSAAVAALVAAELAVVPAVIKRRSSAATLMQAALMGTVIQMMLMLMLGAGAWAMKKATEMMPLAVWVLWLYWVSLAAVVASVLPLIRGSAKPASAQGTESRSY